MVNRARQMFPEMADLPDDELMGAIHATHYPDMSREEFDNSVNANQDESKPVTKIAYSDLTGPLPGKIIMVLEDGTTYVIDYQATDPVDAIDAIIEGKDDDLTQEGEPPSLADNLDFKSNDVPVDENRLNFEIGLIKNKKTSKTAVLLPPETTVQQAKQIAANSKMKAIKQGAELYLFDPKQISEVALRKQIALGKNGVALGYGTDKVPENGVPYAIDTNGHGTVNADEIVALRDSGQLGFSGVAPDMETAMAKIREMGRNNADVRGLKEP